MRFKSGKVGGFQLFAVAGTNTVSFGIGWDPARTAGLLGFAVEREDPAEQQRYFMYGFKVFESIHPHPSEELAVLTFDHPVQSFVWDDFTAKPDREYVYHFHPLRGTPRNLDRSDRPISIKVQTEPLFSQETHDIFFNRGVASSQAYARKFGNRQPDKLTDPAKKAEALEWLSRSLDEAMLRFVDQARKGDTILGCFYEFHYGPVLARLKSAIDRGVDVRLILDAKRNGRTDKDGKVHDDFPRKANQDAVRNAGIPASAIACWRERNAGEIQHNKFMVLLRGPRAEPAEIWTGSTNLSTGGVHGQTNVGHWVRDARVASLYRDYWNLLSGDPGKAGGGRSLANDAAMRDLRRKVDGIGPFPSDLASIAPGVTPVFSPRTGTEMLDLYADLLDQAQQLGCVTLAFGVGDVFKTRLVDNDPRGNLCFLLLEKKDQPRKNAAKPFVELSYRQNVYQAYGSFIRDPLYQWTRETNAAGLGLNRHVSYIHSKFLLRDPLGADPIVVTGSANFSVASTTGNDENMLVIRGDRRVADIYFTEFNRLFFHYYFRSVREDLQRRDGSGGAGMAGGASPLFLSEDDSWLQKYRPGSLKTKRANIFTGMAGAVRL